MNRVVSIALAAMVCVTLASTGCAKKQERAAAAPQTAPAEPRGMLSPGGDAGGPSDAAGGSGQPGAMEMPPGHEQMVGTIETPPSSSPTAAAGVKWTTPRSWKVNTDRPMRVATYLVPAAAGDPEGGECGVFYFGPSQGGDLESNIQRWVGQFENAGPVERTARDVRGLKVSLVRVTGTYLAPSGPMMQSSGSHAGYALLGAIVAAPQGSVFFKLTGPRATLDAARKDFDALVASLQKE